MPSLKVKSLMAVTEEIAAVTAGIADQVLRDAVPKDDLPDKVRAAQEGEEGALEEAGIWADVHDFKTGAVGQTDRNLSSSPLISMSVSSRRRRVSSRWHARSG